MKSILMIIQASIKISDFRLAFFNNICFIIKNKQLSVNENQKIDKFSAMRLRLICHEASRSLKRRLKKGLKRIN